MIAGCELVSIANGAMIALLYVDKLLPPPQVLLVLIALLHIFTGVSLLQRALLYTFFRE